MTATYWDMAAPPPPGKNSPGLALFGPLPDPDDIVSAPLECQSRSASISWRI